MKGGPTRKPVYAAVETAARVGPVAISSVRPAALRAAGKTIEKPAPALAKPTSATRGCPTASAVPSPTAARAPQERTSVAEPRRSVKPSPKRRPKAIETENAAYPAAAKPGPVPRVLFRKTALQSPIAPSLRRTQNEMIPSPKRARVGRANAWAPSSEASACEGKSVL